MMRIRTLLLLIFCCLPGWSNAETQETADSYFRSEKWPEAETAYQQLVKEEPSNGQNWLRLGISRHELGKHKEAMVAYENAEKNGTAPAQVKYYRARTYAVLSNLEEALASLQGAADSGYRNLKMLQNETDFTALRKDPRFENVVLTVQKTLTPCRFSPEFRAFDFWIGEWNVEAAGNLAGTSSIQLILDDCVIFENWTGAAGYSGKSFNVYNPALKKWQQLWVDNTGGVLQLTGNSTDGNIVYHGQTLQADGTIIHERLTFYRLSDQKVRQVWEQSKDQKKWNTVFDGLYTRK